MGLDDALVIGWDSLDFGSRADDSIGRGSTSRLYAPTKTVTPNLPSYAMNNRISIVQGIGEAQLKFEEHSKHPGVDTYDDLLVPLTFPRDLGSWEDGRTEKCRVLGTPYFSRRSKYSSPQSKARSSRPVHIGPSIMMHALSNE